MAGNKPEAPARFATVREFAAELKVSERTLWRVIAKGDLVVHRIQNAVRISPEARAAYLKRVRDQ